MPAAAALRIAVCDRSAAYGRALGGFLERDPGVRVVGVFSSAEQMLRRLDGLDPDLVVVELELGGMGAPAAVGRIMEGHPRPIVVLSSGEEADVRLDDTLAAGALEAIAKTSLHLDGDDVWATASRSRFKRLAALQLASRPRGGRVGSPPAPRAGDDAVAPARPPRVIGIGASTGGPPALARVLGALPADFPLPVLVVQHIAPGFAAGLLRWLDREVPLPVAFARDGARTGPGIWFAPEGVHLRLDAMGRFVLDAHPDTGPHRPSLDALLGSFAVACPGASVAVVLTGMGRDGAEGVEALRLAGGLVIAQDEASSTVFGMPRAAIESGADRILALDDIGPALARLPVAAAPA
jgi:two-component system, chemotaxis family, protein-glutamate methylesterase/glutaminase